MIMLANKSGQHRQAALLLQHGFSLIELMISVAIGLILTIAVAEIFLGNRDSYRLQEAQSRLQESGRLAIEMLTRDLRQAGHMGCAARGPQLEILALPPDEDALDYSPAAAVTGYEASDNGWIPNTPPAGWPVVPANVMAGTDIVTIQYAQQCGGAVQSGITAMTSNPEIKIAAGNTCQVNASTCAGASCGSGNILILADCGAIDVFRADSATTSSIKITGTTSNQLDHFAYPHDVDAELMVFRSRTYFIRAFNGEPTLYRAENTDGSTPQPLLEGVEDMQVTYGMDTDPSIAGIAYRYFTADQINAADWGNVSAVHVDLTLRTSGNAGDRFETAGTNPCSGEAIADHRLRRCFGTTINLRNSPP